jgi:hypothetical protein
VTYSNKAKSVFSGDAGRLIKEKGAVSRKWQKPWPPEPEGKPELIFSSGHNRMPGQEAVAQKSQSAWFISLASPDGLTLLKIFSWRPPSGKFQATQKALDMLRLKLKEP